ncbi:Fe-S cluster assembly protein SufD [Marinobacterium sp. D7]|uniref:Fe-S cluster assembly protein SufD n=1 Tax=Marinobacterium ramblicola TaxID=2849041 RepID=UPI001C2D7F57|nr:Fe-S cluster assembly protein SufD [Marinobacterium ramblicola]MBV1789830.1 Fe-S cluster assembly protein SufD [Marinobacterium ramblicola]
MAEGARLIDTPCWTDLAGADLPWLRLHRLQAFERLSAEGLPARGDEAWKYTLLGDLGERRFRVASRAEDEGSEAGSSRPYRPQGHRILFRDGRWIIQGSTLLPLPAGARLVSLREAIAQQDPLLPEMLGRIATLEGQPFAALNAARFDDGLLLYLPEGCVLEQPIYCRFETDPTEADRVSFPRLLVVMESGSRAQLLEEHLGANGSALTDLLVEISLGEGAQLFHGRLFDSELGDRRISGIHVQQARASLYHSFALMLGGELCRNDLQVQLNGEEASALLEGLYLLDGRQHLDNHLRVDHRLPGGRSDQFYKGILRGHARAVFNGLAVVHPDAQHSDARQINRNLLLSTGAEVDTKPELQIEADDVKCSHGATVGYLDQEQLFYLRSRGVEKQSAQALLTLAFARESLQRLPRGEFTDAYDQIVTDALAGRIVSRPEPSPDTRKVSDE